VEVADAIAAGVRRALPDADLDLAPMADGGEGTVGVLVAATRGTGVTIEVTGPLGTPVSATYGILGDGRTAIIEMSAASGLALVPNGRRDPRITATRGTGDLIRDALGRGIRRIIVGIGGSATNDGGAGMAQALGYALEDAAGNELGPGGAALARLERIDARRRDPLLDGSEVDVACDVANPLCGPEGASRVYGPQKGASEPAVLELDDALRHFAAIVRRDLGKDVLELPGAGAAGGLGAGLAAFAGGRLRPGVELVAEVLQLAERVKGAALVITGEGALDGQTAHGKTPLGVARIAKSEGVPVIALAGTLGTDYRELYAAGIDAAFSICGQPMTFDEAIDRARELLADTAEAVARTWVAARRTGQD
ncbi:MAG TPA: glycerate kinase, partial [Candidatus Hydrogenedentes bacterium]|nr:glycerate kinase [Candidatus Hydrogenedentota bacterium]